MKSRYEELVETNSDLFDKTREDKLSVWAQIKLNRLREVLMREANETDMLRLEIDRVMESPRQDEVTLNREEWGAIIEALGERESLLQEKIPPGGSWDSNDHRPEQLRKAMDKFANALDAIIEREQP